MIKGPPASVHQVLAEMAWEQIPRRDDLKAHVRKMAEILSNQEQYQELWRRFRRGFAEELIRQPKGSQ